MAGLRGSELLILLVLVIVLFGAKRLPDAARSVGRSLRIFKAETRGLVDEGTSAGDGPALGVQAVPPVQAPPVQQAQPVEVQPIQAQPPNQA